MAMADEARRQRVMDRALELFGTTYDHLRAGFILPSGDILDLPPFNHEKIRMAYAPGTWPRGMRMPVSGVRAFVVDGAVRVSARDKFVWVETANTLTRQQIAALQFLIDANPRTGVVVDIRTTSDVHSKEWQHHLPSATALDFYVRQILEKSRTNPRDYWGRQGAGFLFARDGQVFLTHRSVGVNEPHTWGVPGGKVDFGEDALTAAAREVFEELGSLPAYKVVDEVVYNDGDFTYTTFVAEVLDDEWPVELRLNWENDAAGWFNLEEALNLSLHFGVQHVLDRIRGISQHQNLSWRKHKAAVQWVRSATWYHGTTTESGMEEGQIFDPCHGHFEEAVWATLTVNDAKRYAESLQVLTGGDPVVYQIDLSPYAKILVVDDLHDVDRRKKNKEVALQKIHDKGYDVVVWINGEGGPNLAVLTRYGATVGQQVR